MQFRCVPVHPVLRYVTGPAEAELAWAFAGPAAGAGGGRLSGCFLDKTLFIANKLLQAHCANDAPASCPHTTGWLPTVFGEADGGMPDTFPKSPQPFLDSHWLSSPNRFPSRGQSETKVCGNIRKLEAKIPFLPARLWMSLGLL